ncbi:MAG TPA: hypothetical protein VFQ53_29375 [Kofleriaceae bacterium]|nr:hypothetical protein [Kofleriaceae bacterium]
MKLVEAEAEGPVEGETPIVTPPVPPHRRVSVSLLFTLTVLTGTVVAIYLTFPQRNKVLIDEALHRHREPPAAWDLVAPNQSELRAWAMAVVGKSPPLPPSSAQILGAHETSVLGRRAAVIRVAIGREELTYLVQYTRVISPEHTEKSEDGLRAVAWRDGPFTSVVVGPERSASTWRAAFP